MRIHELSEKLVPMENNWLAGGIVIAVTGGCLIVAALVIALRGLENRDRQVPDARPLEH